MDLSADHLHLLRAIYAYAVETGQWPHAKTLRLQFFLERHVKLETIAREIGSELMPQNDFTSEQVHCVLHLKALAYIPQSEGDRNAIGRLVEWLFKSYSHRQTKGIDPKSVAQDLGVEVASLNRALAFIYYNRGLLGGTTSLGDNILGFSSFDIDDGILDFAEINTYDALIERFDRFRAEEAKKLAAYSNPPLLPFSFANDAAPVTVIRLDLSSMHASLRGKPADLFDDGHYQESSRMALQVFEAEVRRASGIDDHGLSLMSKAFRVPTTGCPRLSLNPCKTSAEKAEQEGLQFLAMGAMGLIRNPLSHGESLPVEADAALEVLGLASLLLRQLERTRLADH